MLKYVEITEQPVNGFAIEAPQQKTMTALLEQAKLKITTKVAPHMRLDWQAGYVNAPNYD